MGFVTKYGAAFAVGAAAATAAIAFTSIGASALAAVKKLGA